MGTRQLQWVIFLIFLYLHCIGLKETCTRKYSLSFFFQSGQGIKSGLYPKVLTLVNILFNNRIIFYTGVLMSRASGSARAVGEPMRRSAVWTRTYKRVQILFRYIFLSLSKIIKTLRWSTKRKADLGYNKNKFKKFQAENLRRDELKMSNYKLWCFFYWWITGFPFGDMRSSRLWKIFLSRLLIYIVRY